MTEFFEGSDINDLIQRMLAKIIVYRNTWLGNT